SLVHGRDDDCDVAARWHTGDLSAARASGQVRQGDPCRSQLLSRHGRYCPGTAAGSSSTVKTDFMPVESQNSTPDISTTSRSAPPSASALTSSPCSRGTVYRSISPLTDMTVRSPRFWLLTLSSTSRRLQASGPTGPDGDVAYISNPPSVSAIVREAKKGRSRSNERSTTMDPQPAQTQQDAEAVTPPPRPRQPVRVGAPAVRMATATPTVNSAAILTEADERLALPASPPPDERTGTLREQLEAIRLRTGGAASWLESS